MWTFCIEIRHRAGINIQSMFLFLHVHDAKFRIQACFANFFTDTRHLCHSVGSFGLINVNRESSIFLKSLQLTVVRSEKRSACALCSRLEPFDIVRKGGRSVPVFSEPTDRFACLIPILVHQLTLSFCRVVFSSLASLGDRSFELPEFSTFFWYACEWCEGLQFCLSTGIVVHGKNCICVFRVINLLLHYD